MTSHAAKCIICLIQVKKLLLKGLAEKADDKRSYCANTVANIRGERTRLQKREKIVVKIKLEGRTKEDWHSTTVVELP